MKKSMAFLTAWALFSSMTFSQVFAFDNAIKTDILNYNNEKITISLKEYEYTRTVSVIGEDGVTNVIEANNITGEVYVNGKPVETKSTKIPTFGFSKRTSDNWTTPSTNSTDLSLVGYASGVAIGIVMATYGLGPTVAQQIVSAVIGAGGLLTVKSTTQLNFVDFSPKVGYKLTEEFYVSATNTLVHTRYMEGSR